MPESGFRIRFGSPNRGRKDLIPSSVMQSIFFVALIAPMAVRGTAQTAEVTFYSSASLAAEAIPVADVETGFNGFVYDGPQELVHLRHGRFATFILPAGHHAFSASLKRHPAKNSQLSIDLAPGSHSYFAVNERNANLYAFGFPRGVIHQVSCEEARKRGEQTIQARPKDSTFQPAEAAAATFPSCAD